MIGESGADTALEHSGKHSVISGETIFAEIEDEEYIADLLRRAGLEGARLA